MAFASSGIKGSELYFVPRGVKLDYMPMIPTDLPILYQRLQYLVKTSNESKDRNI